MTLTKKYPHIIFQRQWEITNKCYCFLGECAALVESIAQLPLQPNYHQDLLNVSLIKGARSTTAIEGNTLTDADIEIIKKGESLPPSKEYQEVEIKNILSALNTLLKEIVRENKTYLITPTLLKRFHKMVGKNLGKHFAAIPGKYRTDQRIVGTYKTPDYKDVPELVNELCSWLKKDFHFTKGQQFYESVIQAIITHIFIERIHPFGDGNGRVGRLVEFYILLRAGTPDIASHILSNHYNETRANYYRQFDNALKANDLTEFIEYAVQGYRDGLVETFNVIKENLLDISWRKFVYDSFAKQSYVKKEAFKRKRRLILEMPTDKKFDIDEITLINPQIAKRYANLSKRTVLRDLKELEEMELIKKINRKYQANMAIIQQMIPAQKILQ